MNAKNWRRGRRVLHAAATACETTGHDWLDADPITERRHCRRCPAFLPGIPDHMQEAINHGQVDRTLNWMEVHE